MGRSSAARKAPGRRPRTSRCAAPHPAAAQAWRSDLYQRQPAEHRAEDGL